MRTWFLWVNPRARRVLAAGASAHGARRLLLAPCPLLFSFATHAVPGSRVEAFGGLLLFSSFSLSALFLVRNICRTLSEGLSSRMLAGWVCWFGSVFVCPAVQEEIVISV